jgi:fructosamine-3-kinase
MTMNNIIENQIAKFVSKNKIIKRSILSQAFNINCEKITLDNNKSLVAKYYIIENKKFNSIESETKSLLYLLKKFPHTFPSVKYFTDDLLIMDYIEHDDNKNKNYQNILAREILKLHSMSNKNYGFEFDSQIGGLKQDNSYNSNWINFFGEQRLNIIFELINQNDSMPKDTNKLIEKLLRSLESRIPKNPKPSLLHGDLWSGNILFHNNNFAGFIDPGIYFGHNELELAYLTWFKYIDDIFLNIYSEAVSLHNDYLEYEPIYQLYFSLLNVFLWDRNYIVDVNRLLNKLRL